MLIDTKAAAVTGGRPGRGQTTLAAAAGSAKQTVPIDNKAAAVTGGRPGRGQTTLAAAAGPSAQSGPQEPSTRIFVSATPNLSKPAVVARPVVTRRDLTPAAAGGLSRMHRLPPPAAVSVRNSASIQTRRTDTPKKRQRLDSSENDDASGNNDSEASDDVPLAAKSEPPRPAAVRPRPRPRFGNSKAEESKRQKRYDESDNNDSQASNDVVLLTTPPAPSKSEHTRKRKVRAEDEHDDDHPAGRHLTHADKGKGRANTLPDNPKPTKRHRRAQEDTPDEEDDDEEEEEQRVDRRPTRADKESARAKPVLQPLKGRRRVADDSGDEEDLEHYQSGPSELDEPSHVPRPEIDGPCSECTRRGINCVTTDMGPKQLSCNNCKTQKHACNLLAARRTFFGTTEGFKYLKALGLVPPVPTKTRHNTTLTGDKPAKVKIEKKAAEKPKPRANVKAAAAAGTQAAAGPSKRTTKPVTRAKAKALLKNDSRSQSLVEGTDSEEGAYNIQILIFNAECHAFSCSPPTGHKVA